MIAGTVKRPAITVAARIEPTEQCVVGEDAHGSLSIRWAAVLFLQGKNLIGIGIEENFAVTMVTSQSK